MMPARAALGVLLALACTGCLDAMGTERVGYSSELRREGERVVSIEADELLMNRVLNNDGIDSDLVALRTGYAGGERVRYWDFGVAPSSLEPIWTFRKRDKDGNASPIGHFDLIESIPGDMGYSPLRAVYVVFVASAYAGERITSLRALEDAIELGLVEEPEKPTVYVDRPVAPAAVGLPWGNDSPPSPTEPVYYRGRVAAQFRIGGEQERVFPIGMGPPPTPSVYALRRQSDGAPLDEAAWKMDLDGDGDQDDSNLVFALDAAAPQYSALWRPVEVIVADDYAFGASRAEADLFERGDAGLHARAGVLRWQQAGEMLRHLVLVEPYDE